MKSGAVLVILCALLAVAHDFCAAARPLTRGELAPLLEKKVVTPDTTTPHATPWPEEFSIAFTTDDGAASGRLYYDWGSRQQVIFHGQGASHCRARGSAGACYIIENSRGTFEVDPVARTCEITSQWGTVPPTWVVPGVFAGTFDVDGLKCNRFDYPPSMHSWLETVDSGLPCAFLFPKPSLTYIFAPSTLKLEKPASSIFAIPDYCPGEATSDAPLKAILWPATSISQRMQVLKRFPPTQFRCFLAEEVIALLVAYVFVRPCPHLPPLSSIAGFFR